VASRGELVLEECLLRHLAGKITKEKWGKGGEEGTKGFQEQM